MDNRAKWASAATMAWLAGTALVIAMNWEKFNAMELNAVGDFLAGAVSPLAFLWLIVGYFQQGDELKQNTQALIIQAEELRQSVAAQQSVAESSREQIRLHMEQKNELIMKEKKERKILPTNESRKLPMVMVDAKNRPYLMAVTIHNGGGRASNLLITSHSEYTTIEQNTFPKFDNANPITFNLRDLPPQTSFVGDLIFSYSDSIHEQCDDVYYFVIFRREFALFATHDNATNYLARRTLLGQGLEVGQ